MVQEKHYFKRCLSLLLSFVMIVSVFTGLSVNVEAVSFIKNPASANGANYTTSSSLATALNNIFYGDVDIYTNSACTSEVSLPIGTSMNNSTQFYVKSKTTGNNCSGWQCYIYANAVYNKLFNEWVGHGNSFAHSVRVIGGGSNTASYSLFNNAGVKCGAYIRTTNKSDGTYNGSAGHSMIVLSYNSSGITYLEGNGDGNGLVRITTRTWAEFNSSQLSGKSRYISHVVQPTNDYYNSLYTSYVDPYFTSVPAQNIQLKLHANSGGVKLEYRFAGDASDVGFGIEYKSCRFYDIYYDVNGYMSVVIKPDGVGQNRIRASLYNMSGSRVANYMIYIDVIDDTCEYYGHTYTSVIVNNPTCTATGAKKHTCSYCGYSYTETLSATNHALCYILASEKPTCTTQGKTEGRQCAFCGKLVDAQDTIPATGHTYKDGVCTVCGKWQNKTATVKLTKVENTTSGVKVTWSKLSGAKKYLVYRKTTGGWTRLDTVTGTSFTDETAKSGTTYKYTVKAQIGNSYSDYNTSGLSIKYLAAPKISSVENKNTGISVKWNKVSGAKGYIVYRKAAGASSWTNLGTTTSTSFADKTAKNNVKYTYTVKAYNGSTKSAHYSSGKSLVRLVTPKLTKVTATTGKNTFTFGKVTGATTYVVYRKTGSGSWKKIATTKSTSYVDKSVKKGTYYTYTVRAYKSGSYSYYNTTGLKVKAK